MWISEYGMDKEEESESNVAEVIQKNKNQHDVTYPQAAIMSCK